MKKILVLILLIISVYSLFGNRVVTLAEAKKLLLANNPEYLAKEAALKTAEWEAAQSFFSLFPSARLQGGYTYLDPKPFIAAQENYTYSYGLAVSQPIFIGGKLWLSHRMKRDAYRIAKSDLDSKRLSLLNKLEEAYYDYLLLQELYNISQNAFFIAEQHLEIARIRLEEGTLSRAGFLQFQAELSTKEVSLLQSENVKELSYRQLQNLLKIDDFEITPVDFTAYQELQEFYRDLDKYQREAVREKVVQYGLENNPILNISRTGKKISKKALSLAKGNFLPSINFNASRNWSNNYSGEDKFDPTTTLALTASIPIFPIVDNYASYRQSYYTYRRVSGETEFAEDNIIIAIEAAFYTGISSAKSIASAELARQYAAETYQMMEERFRNGLISSVDLISIEMLLNTGNLNAVRSKYDFLKNRSALMYLLNIEDEEKLLDIIRD